MEMSNDEIYAYVRGIPVTRSQYFAMVDRVERFESSFGTTSSDARQTLDSGRRLDHVDREAYKRIADRD